MSQAELTTRLVLGTQSTDPALTSNLLYELQERILLTLPCRTLATGEATYPRAPVTALNPLESVGVYLQYAVGRHTAVALQFCEVLAARRLTCPLCALPEVLDLGLEYPDIVRPILGPRGEWLARFKPEWALLFAPLEEAGSAVEDAAEFRDMYRAATPANRIKLYRRLFEANVPAAIDFAIEHWEHEVTAVRVGMLQRLRFADFQACQALVDLAMEERAPEVQSEARQIAALGSPIFREALASSLVDWMAQPTQAPRFPLDWSTRLLPPVHSLEILGGWDAFSNGRYNEVRTVQFLNGIAEACILHEDGNIVEQLCDFAFETRMMISLFRDALRLIPREILEEKLQIWINAPRSAGGESLIREAILALGTLNKDLSNLIGEDVVNFANRLKEGRKSSPYKDASFALTLNLDAAEDILDRLSALPLSPRDHWRRVWIPILFLRLKLFRPIEALS